MAIGNILGQYGTALGKFTGMGQAPDPTIVPLDADTQGLLNQSVDRASRPDAEFAASLNQGAVIGAGQLGQSEMQGQQEAQRLGDTYSDAIRQSYASRANDSVGRLIRANEYKAKLQKGDQMRQMSQAAMAQQNVATQNYAMLTEAFNQSEMARANFVSQIFQTGNQAMVMKAAQSRKASQQATSPSMTDEFEQPEIGSSGANQNVGGYGLGISGPKQSRFNVGGNYGY